MFNVFVGIFCISILNTIPALPSDIELLRSELEDVKQSFSNEISRLKSEMRLQEKATKDQLMRQDLEITSLRKTIFEDNGTQKKRLLMPPQLSINRTAFYVHLTKDQDNLGIHQPIIFDAVKFNQGNGYNIADGVFRVPLNGTYFFIWTTSNSEGTSMQSELAVNGIPFGKIISDAANHNDWASSTAFAIVSLQLDDRVWIRTGTVHNLHHLSGEGYGTSSFAGFLLW